MASDAYFLNGANIVHEAFEDEVVVANLETGTYYALKREAADIWKWVLQGGSLEELVEASAGKYAGDRTRISSAVAAFLDQLLAEGLLRTEPAPSPRRAVLLSMPAPSNPTPFIPPALEIHRDLQDLLLLDPIHEVGPEGWPARK